MLFLLFIFRIVAQIIIFVDAVIIVVQVGIAFGLLVRHFTLEEVPHAGTAYTQNQKPQKKPCRIGFLFRFLDRLRGGGSLPTHSVMFLAQMGQVVFT